MQKKVDKRVIERHQINRFLSNKELGLNVSKIEDGTDPPDFVITVDDKIISVEITRIFDSVLKEKEEFINRIINHAEKLFKEKYNVDLYCLITFLNINLDGGHQMFQKFSEQLFLEIEKIYLKNMGKEFDVQVQDRNLKSEFLNKLSVRNTMGFNNWQHFSAYRVDSVDVGKLQSIIMAKDKDIKRYEGKYNQHWLLIVSNIGTKSSANQFEFLDFSSIETKFDKVYVLMDMPDEVVTIK